MKKRLSQYLSTAAATSASLVYGQDVLYTDFNPDLVLEGNLNDIKIDINQDSIEDFVLITEDTMVAVVNGSYNIGRLRAGGYANLYNQIMGSIPSGYGYVDQLSNGDMVGPGEDFIFAGTMVFTKDGQNPFNEPWNGGAFDKYIGFRIRYTADSSHYGWIRLDVGADGKRAVIKDAAFSLLPDTVIAAGSAALSNNDGELDLENVVQNLGTQLQFAISREWENSQFELFNTAGQRVWSWTAEGGHHLFQLPEETGVYILIANRKGILGRQKIIR